MPNIDGLHLVRVRSALRLTRRLAFSETRTVAADAGARVRSDADQMKTINDGLHLVRVASHAGSRVSRDSPRLA